MSVETEMKLSLERSDVEQHLRDALTHIASAEALLQIDGVENHPALEALTTQIMTRTVSIGLIGETDETSKSSIVPSANGHKQKDIPDIVEERVDQSTTTNDTIVIDEVEQDTPTEPRDQSTTTSGTDSEDGIDLDEKSDSKDPWSADRPTLTDRENVMFSDMIERRPDDVWFKVGSIDLSIDFRSKTARKAALTTFMQKVVELELVDHNGGVKNGSKYKINDDAIASLAELKTSNGGMLPQQTILPSDVDTPDFPGEAPLKSSELRTEEQITIEAAIQPLQVQPEVEYEGDIRNDAKLRRNDIIKIKNLDELNEWIASENPYGTLPKVFIESPRSLTVNGKMFGLSDAQREFLNILLANYGTPLTQADILAQGFSEYTGNKEAMRSFTGTVERFMTARIDEDGNPLLLGDKQNGRDFILNPGFLIYDNRGESVKKN